MGKFRESSIHQIVYIDFSFFSHLDSRVSKRLVSPEKSNTDVPSDNIEEPSIAENDPSCRATTSTYS